MDLGLRDKVAIITGSSRGLGFAAAQSLAAEGCRVCLCARTASTLEAAAQHIVEQTGTSEAVLTVAADVTAPHGVETVMARTVERFGGIDVLVNNVARAEGGGLLDTSDADWQAAVDQTLFPAIRMSRGAVPHMKARGGGVIILIASIFGREAG